jgi:hypothetical protein
MGIKAIKETHTWASRSANHHIGWHIWYFQTCKDGKVKVGLIQLLESYPFVYRWWLIGNRQHHIQRYSNQTDCVDVVSCPLNNMLSG